MTAIYVYECSVHGRFEVSLRFGSTVPLTQRCGYPWCTHNGCMNRCEDECGRESKRVLTPPSSVTVKGGTGARKRG